MGIKKYLPNLKISSTLQNKEKIEYECIYLDCNYLIHLLIHGCNNNDDLYDKTFKYCKSLFNFIKVNKYVYIIFDGINEHEFNPKENTHILRNNKNLKNNDSYDKQIISHNTEIIKYYENILIQIIEKIKIMNMFDYEIVLSLTNISGEADIKILNTIYDKPETNICILTKDTDLIQIAFVNSLTYSINVDVLISIFNDEIKYVKYDTVKNILNPIITINNKTINYYSFDYILLIALMGNDYLPKISNIDYETIITAYNLYKTHGHKNIIQKQKFKSKLFRLFISYLIYVKKLKFNIKKLQIKRYQIYYNNLNWFLKYYKVINNDCEFIKYDKHKDFSSVINIFNLFL